MIGLLQRVTSASVAVGGREVARIERGLLVLVGVQQDDDEARAARLLERLLGYRVFPDDELADDAQYWIGESYFSLARSYGNSNQPDKATQALEQAVQEFKKVVANFPRGDKTPTALYKEALALIELKQADLARARLQYLVDNFPQAAEAPLARERLTSLKER